MIGCRIGLHLWRDEEIGRRCVDCGKRQRPFGAWIISSYLAATAAAILTAMWVAAMIYWAIR